LCKRSAGVINQANLSIICEHVTEVWQQYHDENDCTCSHRPAVISLYDRNNEASCFYEWVHKYDEYVPPSI